MATLWIWGFECEQCGRIELVCAPCMGRRQFCGECAAKRLRESRRRAERNYRRTAQGALNNRRRQRRHRQKNGRAPRARRVVHGSEGAPDEPSGNGRSSPSPSASGAGAAGPALVATATSPPASAPTPATDATPPGAAAAALSPPGNASLRLTAPRDCRRLVALPTDLAEAARERSGSGEREDARTPPMVVRTWKEIEVATRRGERPAQGCCARCGRTGALMYLDGRLAITRPRAERVDDTG